MVPMEANPSPTSSASSPRRKHPAHEARKTVAIASVSSFLAITGVLALQGLGDDNSNQAVTTSNDPGVVTVDPGGITIGPGIDADDDDDFPGSDQQTSPNDDDWGSSYGGPTSPPSGPALTESHGS